MIILAAALVLAFQFPHAYVPAPSHYVVTATHDGVSDTLRVGAPGPGGCKAVPGSNEDTVCTTWPGCPQDAVVTIHVQAAWGETLSASTELVVCQFTLLAPCECLRVETAAPPALPPLPVAPPPSMEPAPVLLTPTAAKALLPTPSTQWVMPTKPAPV